MSKEKENHNGALKTRPPTQRFEILVYREKFYKTAAFVKFATVPWDDFFKINYSWIIL